MLTRVDLHCHTRFSDRPSEWLLRRLDAAESYTDPLALYRACRARGMAFVTVSDHNEIRGALEIAHLPGAFVSNEVTTYFPEDGCKIHCLVFGIDQSQFADIERTRRNIYEFRDYLFDHDILYSVAHPLYAVDGKLSATHVEKLLVLFKRFELINGARDPRASQVLQAIFNLLTPDLLAALADRHGIDPRDGEPWRKWTTGGSDDHSGLYLAGAYTEMPAARSVSELLGHLRHGAHVPGGAHGDSLKLAHSFYSITNAFYRERLATSRVSTPRKSSGGRREPEGDLIGELLGRFLRHAGPAGAVDDERHAKTPFGSFLPNLADGPFARVRNSVAGVLAGVALGSARAGKGGKADRVLVSGVSRLFALEREGGGRAIGSEQPAPLQAERVFVEASKLAHELGYTFVRKLGKHLAKGKLTEAVASLAALGPVAICIAPYLAAFHTQHRDSRLLEGLAERFGVEPRLRRRGERRVWVSDTFGEVNGVSTTIRAVASLARAQGRDLTVMTSQVSPPESVGFDLVNFPPVGSFRLPEYPQQKLGFPPVLEILEWCERERVGELVISTPGPLGLAALAAAKLLAIRVTGVYHTDFPLYVRHLTDSETLEALAWRYMVGFFGQLDRVFVPSQAYITRLSERGLAADRLLAMQRGVDLMRFDPALRDPRFWRRRGLRGKIVFVYAGRLSKEKNLDALVAAFEELRRRGVDAGLALIGDGPEAKRLERHHGSRHLQLTGFLSGGELAQALASADVFVFPSTTDTFGNVVLEAQASGLPAIVSNFGGPPEILAKTGGGVAVDVDRGGALCAAMALLAGDEALRADLAQRARRGAEAMADGWQHFLDDLWFGSAAPAAATGSSGLLSKSFAGLNGSVERDSDANSAVSTGRRAGAEPVFMPGVHSY